MAPTDATPRQCRHGCRSGPRSRSARPSSAPPRSGLTDPRALDAPAGARYLGVEPGEPTMREAVEALIGPVTSSVTAAELGPIGEAFALDQRLTSERARTELGWNPRHSLADTLRRSGPAVR